MKYILIDKAGDSSDFALLEINIEEGMVQFVKESGYVPGRHRAHTEAPRGAPVTHIVAEEIKYWEKFYPKSIVKEIPREQALIYLL